MSKLFSVLIAVAFAAVTFSAVAADAAPAAPKKVTAQQAKMKLCNKEAKEKGLQKADRKAFMKSCLKKGKKDSAAPAAK